MNKCWKILIVCLTLSAPSYAQSLWDQRDPNRVYMLGDTQARHLGDWLVIVIRENTDVENRDQRALEKSTDAGFNFDFSSAGGGGSAAAQMDISKQSDRNFDGSSGYSVEQQFSDRIMVKVIDRLPNGNLVVGGRRQREVSGECRTLVVSGVVRPVDIRQDNSVESRFVGNFNICYSGCGPESSFTNQGWLGRLTNRLWPF